MSISETFEEMFKKRFGRPPTREEMAVFIDQSVSSVNQSGGITAHTVNFGRPQRRMDDVLRADILKNMPRTSPITVMAIVGDAESVQLAQEIHAFLRANGFPLKEKDGISQSVFLAVPKGLGFDRETSTLIVGAHAQR